MPFSTTRELPESVKNVLPQAAQRIWMHAFNAALEEHGSESRAARIAWGAVKNAGFEKDPDTGKWHKKAMEFVITKTDDEQGRVFGWANVAVAADGNPVVDLQEDIIDEVELEKAAYRFMAQYQNAGEMHQRTGVAKVIESMVFTLEKQEALGIPPGTVPVGWWLGLEIIDPSVKKAVRERTLTAFSIGGKAIREEVSDADATS